MRPYHSLQAEGRIDVRLCILARAAVLHELVQACAVPLEEAFDAIVSAIAEVVPCHCGQAEIDAMVARWEANDPPSRHQKRKAA